MDSQQNCNLINADWRLTMTLQDTEELHDNLRGRTDENLALAASLGIDNVVLLDGLNTVIPDSKTINSQGSRSNEISGHI